MSRRSVALVAVVVLACGSGGCDDGGGSRRVRVSFAVTAPESLSRLDAAVSYPQHATPAYTAAGVACSGISSDGVFFAFEEARRRSIDVHMFGDNDPFLSRLLRGDDDAHPPYGDGTDEEDGCRRYDYDDDEEWDEDDDSIDDDPHDGDPDGDLLRSPHAPPSRNVTTRRLFACSFSVHGPLSAGDFPVSVSFAYGAGETFGAEVEVFAEEVVEGEGATTSSSTSTTVLDGETVLYEVVFGVKVAAGALGALQFDVTAREGSGGFVGAGGFARCKAVVPSDLAMFNDRGNGRLSGALVSLDGIETPGDVASCRFRAFADVVAEDFDILVVDAADTEGGPPLRCPSMAVTSLRTLE